VSTGFRVVPDDLGGAEQRPARCAVSFIVPAFQASATIAATIASIRASAPADAEIVVVDDGSLDSTLELARELADVVVPRPCQAGAARARNDGARASSGDVLFFVDADVTVNRAATEGALRHLDRGAAAVFGAYEPLPPPAYRNVATTHKNLLHHYTHLRGAGDAQTFWSGFGAVRRAAFFAVRGFDPAVTTGADVEDIHLGYRLRAAGFEIVLDPTLQVQHHKRYTLRTMILSDVLHRAVPWTRAMLDERTFNPDLNLRAHAIVCGLTTIAIPITLGAALWIGRPALAGVALLTVAWVGLHARFLLYVARQWDARGTLASAALLFLYYLYGITGTVLGVFAYLLRHGRNAEAPRLRLEPVADDGRIDVTVAVVADPGERFAALSAFTTPAPWWELLVVAAEPPAWLPEGARFLHAEPGADRNEMRQLALDHAQGRMLAVLDADCVPEPGWLEQIRDAAHTTTVMVAGSFHDDRRSLRRRAEQIVRYWQWRPERPRGWTVDHPSNNAAYRTDVVRQVGGFTHTAGLPIRLSRFGARPVRFEPGIGVMLRTERTTWSFVRGVAGVSRLRAAATVEYLDISAGHRAVLVASTPVSTLVSLVRIVRSAMRDGLADRSFWLSLPLSAVGLAASGIGRCEGLLRPERIFGADVDGLHDLDVLLDEAAAGGR
jgi:GT2 family glycosyltransferase